MITLALLKTEVFPLHIYSFAYCVLLFRAQNGLKSILSFFGYYFRFGGSSRPIINTALPLVHAYAMNCLLPICVTFFLTLIHAYHSTVAAMIRCQECQRSLEAGTARSGMADSHNHWTPKERKHKPLPKYESKTYERLPTKRGYIRLLNLLASNPENPHIECTLVVTEFMKDSKLKPYEALSWCWGSAKQTSYIHIRKDGQIYAKYVSRDLVHALKVLRHPKRDRYLWIDAVCIDQETLQEKNHQVEMMSDIYGRADCVCIWLGDGDKASQMALRFIKKEVLQLQNFDELCESEQASEKWGALLDLMQRPWFSRRWVVQEIALARKAVIYCGADRISWRKFAVAVELFVEVETATHRLSEVMKKDPKFYHVPGWFEYVSALGATLLVEATGILFRDYKTNGLVGFGSDSESDSESNSGSEAGSDAESEAESDAEFCSEADSDLETVSKPKSGPKPDPKPDPGVRAVSNAISLSKRQPLLSLEYLVSRLSIFEASVEHDTIYALLAIAKDTTPSASEGEGESRLVLDHTQDVLEVFTQQKRYNVEYEKPYVDVCKDFVEFCIERGDPTRALDIICRPWAPEPKKKSAKRNLPTQKTAKDVKKGKNDKKGKGAKKSKDSKKGVDSKKGEEEEKLEDDVPLPSWIPQLSGAAYAMYAHAGIHTLKMGRKNADTFVGLPASNQRNYNAAESKRVDLKTLKFRKRPKLKHYSMYVKGFVLDIVTEVQPFSQGGAIPREWSQAGGWANAPDTDPPDEFWRTLVADRGRDGKNPPVYYARACKESFSKGGLSSGSVNTTDLINNERCSVVAQFCRRVQAVIWNRSLIRTVSGNLGLANSNVQPDLLVCILYGCSVPVILKSKEKTSEEINLEIEDEIRHRKTEWFHRWKKNARRIKVYREKRENGKKWETNMRKAYYREKVGVVREVGQNLEEWKKEMRKKIEQDPYFRETAGVAVENKEDYEKWKKEKRDKAKKEGKEKEWNEPKVNWLKFEAVLKIFRRRKKLALERREGALQKFLQQW